MFQQRPWVQEIDEEIEEANRQTASLGGVAVTLVLLILGLFLIRALHSEAAIEDCLLSGRTNCDAMVSAPP
jgi:hypothetical protein